MKLKPILHSLPFLFSTALALNAHAVEIQKWNGTPIQADLQVNKQRLIRLPDNAMFRLPTGVKKDINAEIAAGVLYITPKKPMNNIPLEIKLGSSGEIIKMNISTVKNKRLSPQVDEDLRVVMPWEKDIVGNQMQQVKQKKPKIPNVRFGVTPEEFVRYAAMRDFEPSRLWKNNPQISEFGIPKNISLGELFYGSSTDIFKIKIHRVYKSGDKYLTSLILKNTQPYPVDIKFDDIAINFQYASTPEAYYSLGNAESNQDYSFLYLITKKPINQLIKFVDPRA